VLIYDARVVASEVSAQPSVAARPAAARQWSSVLSPLLVAVAMLAAAYVALVVINAAPLGNIHTGDTDNLVAGTHQAIHCVRDGDFSGCGLIPGADYSTVFPYPLLQYGPSAVLVAVGLDDAHVVKGLARLSSVAFVACLALAMWCLRGHPGRAALAVAAIIGSSATYQATAGFGEMLAASAVLAAAVAAWSQRPALTVATVALACCGKETLAPFVLVLCLVAARREGDGLLPARRQLVSISLGVGLGVALSAAFNLFRFGTVRNVMYLDPLLHTPGIERKLEWWAAVWVSPAAGVAFFWPLATALLAAVAIMAIRRAGRRAPWRSWLPPLAVVVVVVAFSAGLALWLTPFGWIAYGPRLAVPILPAAVVVALLTAGDAVVAVLRRVGHSPLVTAGLVVAAVLIAWPQFAAPWRHERVVGEILEPDATCPVAPIVQEDQAGYYRCTSNQTWRLHPFVFDDAATGGGLGAYLARFVGAALVGVAVAGAARSREDEPRPPAHLDVDDAGGPAWAAGAGFAGERQGRSETTRTL
jgi:hypothetical protein